MACLLALSAAALTSAAASAETIRQWQLAPAAGGGFGLELATTEAPAPGPGEVAVRVRAVSLNRRDAMMLGGRYNPAGAPSAARIPLSDGAGEVVAVGPGVTRLAVGDRVASIFFTDWLDGEPSAAKLASARGGNLSGMLSEIVVTNADALVEFPEHLSFEQAATLPCVGVTAWVALFEHGDIEAGDYVLLEGTGGVSIMGLQLAAAAGARPIITSSSDTKLERARTLGAFGTVNYVTNENWQRDVRALTDGAGVDHVLEVGGRDTLPKAIEALGYGGHIALIGGLSGFASNMPVGSLLTLGASVTGIYVGSREHFAALNAFIAEHRVEPVVDRVFDFEDAPAAFALMEDGEFFGKIVIRL